jgi:hypothetical protein
VLTRFEEENGGQLVIATVCLLETSRHGLLETELLELLADENNLTPPKYVPGEDEPSKTEASAQANGMSDATEALADKLQEQVNIAYVQTEDSKDEQKKKDGEAGKEFVYKVTQKCTLGQC